MDLNSPLFDGIRATRKKADEAPRAVPLCDHPGCNEPGVHRAPKGREREGQYWCFCLEHVRAYNQSYNYFNGMDDDAVTRHQKDASVGHRPTWAMGARGGGRGARTADGAVDPFNLFGRASARRAAPEQKPRVSVAAVKALSALDLDATADAEAIKARYKLLVKRFHPDANGGDRSMEGRFQDIVKAYGVLRALGMLQPRR